MALATVLTLAVASGAAECNATDGDCPSPFYRSELYNTELMARRRSEEFAEDTSITIALHMTVDRMPSLRNWCKYWRGPLSVALYIRPQDDEEEVLTKITGPGCIRKFADLHVVRRASEKLDKAVDMLTHYPFNVVRNAALDGSRTDWVFLLDADFRFRPTGDVILHSNFAPWFHKRRADAEAAGLVGDALPLYIVPAFETVSRAVAPPNTTEELVAALTVQSATLFYGHYCVPCHHPTDSLTWRRTAHDGTPYRVAYSESFEPYVVTQRSRLPAYDERFIGRGWDKMSYFYELSNAGSQFIVLPPPYFLIHIGRGDLPDAKKGSKKGGYSREYMVRQEQNSKHWRDFKVESLLRHGLDVPPELEALVEAEKEAERERERAAEAAQEAGVADGAAAEEAPDKVEKHKMKVMASEEAVAQAAAAAEREERAAASAAAQAAAGDPSWSAHMLPPVDVTDFASSSLTATTVCIAKRDADPDALLGALQWVCGAGGAVNCSEIRHWPDRLVARADWAFDRWYQSMRDVEGDKACEFGGTAELVECDPTPRRCVVAPNQTEEEVQSALEWVCAEGLGSCGWTMEGGPHYVPTTVRHHTSIAFTLHYLVFRCAVPADVLCDFAGVGQLEESPGGWDDVLEPVPEYDNREPLGDEPEETSSEDEETADADPL
eukprot:TRINITY_DN2416_c0_g1_i1.p1 TRINITY_DN2416_c0_g1~~TRINITY_DN2416_c0_g1_i1.p1  ORF type:complete len:682 (+),score=169.98 TRINITY_DN2416_c0_g1_i1:52-2046(+)